MFQYDAEGNLTGWTQAESEWVDVERDKMLDLAQFEREVCECGFHESLTVTDPDLVYDAKVCPVCAGVAKSARVQADRDEKAMKLHGENPPPSADRPDDGRTNYLRTPTEADLKARAADKN